MNTRVIAKCVGFERWYVTVNGAPLKDANGGVRYFESMEDASRAGHAEAKR
jgi:hypothetical protein